MKLSIVIVEYHSLEEIDKYLRKVSGLNDIEVIVSSNSMYSKTEKEDILKKHTGCIWQFNEKNGGFAYAMNNGLAVATGDILVISNPDCSIQHGLKDMAEFLTTHPEVGAIGPKIVDDENNIQDSCRSYVTLPSYIMRQVKRILFKKDSVLDSKFDYNSVQTVDWIIGAFIMVTREVYKKTGGLCDDYFMYAEDLDWCTRIRQAGYEIVYYPKAQIVYKGTRSARSSWKYMKIFLKSHFLYWKRFGYLKVMPIKKDIIYA